MSRISKTQRARMKDVLKQVKSGELPKARPGRNTRRKRRAALAASQARYNAQAQRKPPQKLLSRLAKLERRARTAPQGKVPPRLKAELAGLRARIASHRGSR